MRRLQSTFGTVPAVALSAGLIALGAAACGGSSSTPSSTASRTSVTAASPGATATTSSAAAPTAEPAKATTAAVTTGPVHATLTGQNHTPPAGKLWSYTVQATDPAGHPLSGTVDTDFVFAGLGVVGKESPPTHPLKGGVLHDKVTFPPSALGHPLTLVTVVHTGAGSVALAWPVNVTK